MKIINLILGLGTAIIIGSLIHLGIRAFHPEPTPPDYTQLAPKVTMPYREFSCTPTDQQCIKDRDTYYAEQQAQQDKLNEAQRTYDSQLKSYNVDVFVIANVAGVLVFIIGFLLLFGTALASQSVPIGIMIAGLYGIIYGYARGWNSTNDQLKFFVGLVIALLVIGGGLWLVQRYVQKRNASGAA
jgi:uncharacterized membrane protein YphA (DoxX/SURF4 family)